jgi:tetratricopeptide (TPR) repeat protein
MSEPLSLEQDLADLEAEIARRDVAASSSDQQALCEMLLQRAFTLQTLGRLEDAAVAYGELATRFRDASEDAIRRDVVRALQQRGHLQRLLGREEEAQEPLDEADTIGGALAHPGAEQIQVDLQRATKLVDDGHLAEAMEVLTDVIRPWGHAPPDDAAESVAYATVLAAQTAVRVGPNFDAALQSCDEVVEHYGDSTDPGVRAMVVWSLTTKGYIHACANRHDEAVAWCTRAIEYAGEDQDARVQSSVEDARTQLERWRTAGAGT